MRDPAVSDGDRWGGARGRLVAGVLALVFVVIVGRAAQIALLNDADGSNGSSLADVRRANIVDRNGDLLATSLSAWTLAADPGKVWDAREVAQSVAEVLPGVDVDSLTEKLSNRKRKYALIRRGLTPRQRQSVMELGLEGVYFETELRRVYPAGRLAGHLLGFTDIDGKGIEGLEYVFNDRLARGGEPLRLTIDASVQYALETELELASEEYIMAGAAGMVIDAHTGAVRALASWPFIDPNHPSRIEKTALRNRALNEVFDLGSVYKPLTIAAALESGAVTAGETFDVSQPLTFGPETITDGHEFDYPYAVSIRDILINSSNIGAAQIARRMGIAAHRGFLEKVGLLGRIEYEGPRTQSALPPPRWTELASATVSYGHGIAVTPLAFAMSYVPLANGGLYLAPRFAETEGGPPADPVRVMSEETAAKVVDMMRDVVLQGSGRMADVSGYEVAGKTGTAEKPVDGVYDPNRNVTTFAAIFPASRPEFVVLIVLDEAQPRSGGSRTAAHTAATIAGRLIGRAAPMLDVQPVLAAPKVSVVTIPDAGTETPAL